MVCKIHPSEMFFSNVSFLMLHCQFCRDCLFHSRQNNPKKKKKSCSNSLNIQNKSWVSVMWKQKTNDTVKGYISITLTCIYIFPIWKSMGTVWLSAMWLQKHKGSLPPPWQPQLCPPAEESPMWFASDFFANLQENWSQTVGYALTGSEYLAAWEHR